MPIRLFEIIWRGQTGFTALIASSIILYKFQNNLCGSTGDRAIILFSVIGFILFAFIMDFWRVWVFKEEKGADA